MLANAPPIQAALELFATDLAGLSFGDIDAKTLAQAVADVEEVAAVVASAQAALDSARLAFEARQGALFERVQRALAYARVYADSNEALHEKIDAIRLPRAPRAARASEPVGPTSISTPPPPARRRGRPRKATPDGEASRPADLE